ncbi:MAG TPA: RNA polymerase sigma factor [bacterium]
MSTHAEDIGLVEAFRRGEESAFTALVIKYRESLYRIARRFVHSHEDAADVTQEVLIRVHRALPRFAGRAQLRTWLFRITVNLCLDFASRRSKEMLPGLTDLLKEPTASPDQEPAEWLERRELGEIVVRAIDALPPRQRAMVVLRVYQDLPYADIGQVMGCAEGTVKATMFAAFAKLRKSLAPYAMESRARDGEHQLRGGDSR